MPTNLTCQQLLCPTWSPAELCRRFSMKWRLPTTSHRILISRLWIVIYFYKKSSATCYVEWKPVNQNLGIIINMSTAAPVCYSHCHSYLFQSCSECLFSSIKPLLPSTFFSKPSQVPAFRNYMKEQESPEYKHDSIYEMLASYVNESSPNNSGHIEELTTYLLS